MALFRKTNKQRLARVDSDDERLVQLIEKHRCDAVIDIGANVGQYARRLRAAGWRGRIISVEPASGPYAELEQAAANDRDWIVARRMALGDAEGTATLHVNERSDMNSLSAAAPEMAAAFPKAKEIGTEEVPVRRLDGAWAEIAAAAERAFVKIDAQGYEFQVLDGAEGILSSVAGLQLELPVARLYQSDRHYLDTLNRLHGLGYELEFVFDLYFSRALGRQVKFDGAFFRGAD